MQVKKIFLQIVIVLGIFFVMPLFVNVFAATLQLDPSTVTTTAGQTFEVKINVNAGADQVSSVDAYVKYDSSILEPQSVVNGTYFPTVSNTLTLPGKVYVAGIPDDPASSKTGTGTLATVIFKAKANGTATLSFDCTQGSTTDSNITKNDLNATDAIVCSSNGTSAVTVGTGSSSATATPTPGSNPGSDAVPTVPSQLPRSGVVEDSLPLFAAAGTFLFLIGIGFKLLL